ncbi:MAG: hypothetical protein ACE5H9_17570 [Anaerolineae bacterium]
MRGREQGSEDLWGGFSLFFLLLFIGFTPFLFALMGIIEFSVRSWPWFFGAGVYLVVIVTIAIVEYNKRQKAKAEREKRGVAGEDPFLPSEPVGLEQITIGEIKPKDFGLPEDLADEAEPASAGPADTPPQPEKPYEPSIGGIIPKDFGLIDDLLQDSDPPSPGPGSQADEE